MGKHNKQTQQQLLEKYKVVPSQRIPELAIVDHLRLVADMLAAFESQPTRSYGIFAAFDTLCRAYDWFAERFPKELDGGLRLACTPGCSHCCMTPVTAIPAEVMTIAEVIRGTLSDDQQDALARRLDTYRRAADERGTPDSMCPLNVDGLCSIYRFRPFNCRKFHSFDLEACLRFFRQGTGDLHEIPREFHRGDFAGLFWQSADVAFLALGLDTSDVDFIPALKIALETPDCAEKMLSGKNPFSGVVRADLKQPGDLVQIRTSRFVGPR